MWTTTLILFNFIRMMIYGKSVINPDFEGVDEMFFEKEGISTNWNTMLGKVVYYIFLLILIGVTCFIIRFFFNNLT